MSGSCSNTGAQPTGGEAGGEIKNCLCGDGSFKHPSEFLSNGFGRLRKILPFDEQTSI